ncbi:MAG: hypothetical protein AAFR47_02180 [Pseudomonadota bacterium]
MPVWFRRAQISLAGIGAFLANADGGLASAVERQGTNPAVNVAVQLGLSNARAEPKDGVADRRAQSHKTRHNVVDPRGEELVGVEEGAVASAEGIGIPGDVSGVAGVSRGELGARVHQSVEASLICGMIEGRRATGGND